MPTTPSSAVNGGGMLGQRSFVCEGAGGIQDAGWDSGTYRNYGGTIASRGCRAVYITKADSFCP